jgi:hypothetical protein
MKMVANLKTAKLLWSITEFLALVVSIGGLLIKGIYENLFQADYLPGAVAQDLITVVLSLFLLVLIYFTKQNDVKKQVIIVGVIGSQWYLYGILTIERVYNAFYLFYLAIFALAFWSLLYSLSGYRSEKFQNLRIRNGLLKTTAISSIIIAVLFNILWIMSLIPLMQNHNRIEYLYSIYILDLGFVMPAFFVTAIMSLRKVPFGILMTPAMMIVGFFVIFPLGLNELAKPAFGMTVNYGSMLVSFIFSIYMLTLAYLQLRYVNLER